ncbi:hypothetical protein JCM8547_003363 [Rhodosporidiobolus lusitaniae]
MAAVYSKGLPNAAHQLAGGTPHSLHRDYASPSSSLPASSAFRSTLASASYASSADFGAFAGPSTSRQLGGHAQPPALEGAWGAARVEPGGGELIARGAAHEGAEFAALLGGKGGLLTDAVDGDWEAELVERQNEIWRRDNEMKMPADPFASSGARAARDVDPSGKGKGRAFASSSGNKGDMSPTSSHLLSSLSSLDLSSRAYLRTLLSLPPELAIEDYLAHGSYADDVHGLPADVRALFEKAAAQDEGRGDLMVEGRRKAVRRLGMVMRHLQAADMATSALSEQTSKMSLEEFKSVGMPGRDWRYVEAERAARLRQPSSFTAQQPASAFAQSFLTHPQQQNSLSCFQQQPLVAQSSAPLVFASSLSSSAFITMPSSDYSTSTSASHITPQPARLVSSPPLSQPVQQHPEHAPHDLPSAPLSSFATFFAEQHRRMTTNDFGRRGVDFTAPLAPAAVPAFSTSSGAAGRYEGPRVMRTPEMNWVEREWAHVEEGHRVTEGMSH